MAENIAPAYRPDIDGLRALAILAVVAFHAFPNFVQGGFVGVDVFFVISGYLISGIILNGLSEGEFSFLHFYVRRIKRLFPALITVLLACLIFGWFVLLPDEYRQLGKHIAGGSVFVSNFVLWKESGYFDQFTELKPLLHLWSLGIEEQFYLAWPLLLYLAWKWRLNALLVTLILAFISFGLNVYSVSDNAATAFYWPVMRLWELLIGAILAAVTLRGSTLRIFRNDAYLPVQAGLGLLLIVIAIFVIDKERVFPGWWALLPAVGAALLLATGPDTWVHRKLLSHPAAIWCGLISYPLYLWHWPLLAYLRIVYPDSPPALYRFVVVILGFLLAWLTYLFLERPMRFGRRGAVKAACLVVAMALVGALGVETYYDDGFPSRLPDPIRQFVATTHDPLKDWRLHTCFVRPEEEPFADVNACIEKGQQPLLLLWGDSHAASLYDGLKSLEGEYGFRMAQFTTSSCPPLLTRVDPLYKYCKPNNDAVFALIENIRPDIVLLYANWNDDSATLEQLKVTLAALQKTGVKRIVLMGPTPRWKLKLPGIARMYWLLHQPPPLRMRFRLADRVPDADAALSGIARTFGVEYISSYKALCNDEGCLTHGTGEGEVQALMFDGDHLSPQGSRFLARLLAKDIFPSSPESSKNAGSNIQLRPASDALSARND